MEIAVIELYEGSEQTDELRFNSLTPTLPPVVHAISRAYIFPQGISALGVTETGWQRWQSFIVFIFNCNGLELVTDIYSTFV